MFGLTMNFLADTVSVTGLHWFLLTVLLYGYIIHPEYQWPDDYASSGNYCKGSKCEPNACAASTSNSLPTFDYIIVGSGAAGSTIAYRLVNQFSDRTVLLIERGAEPSVESIPPKFWTFILNTNVMYDYFAEPSVNYSNAFKNGADCNVGKQIGGSTGVNAMMYVCGTDRNYNEWATTIGDQSWNYEEMLEHIRQNQNQNDPELLKGKCAAYHGKDGPLTIATSSFDLSDDLHTALKAAVKEKGIRELVEINCGAPYTGFVHIQGTVKWGERDSAARAFINPIRKNPNFYYMKESTVDKVLFKQDQGQLLVTGVSVLTQQSSCPKITLKAKREVILTAGAYNTPQILLRSGIGRAADLQKCSIPQLNDLPVGYHLSDHFMTMHFYTMPSGIMSSFWGASAFFMYQGIRMTILRDGFFTTSGFNHNLFINTTDSNSSYPNIQIIFGFIDQNTPDVDKIFKLNFGFKDEFADKLVTAAREENSVVFAINTLLQPKSRGKVELRSCSDPNAAPIIKANYLSEQEDFDTTLRGIEILNDFMSTQAMKDAKIKQMDLKITECDVNARNSDGYNRCYMKYFSQNLWHPTGTCRMGSSSADNVVDTRLKVFGVGKTDGNPMLRVADASVMPIITSGNVQCPVYAIAEKAAKTIIADNY